MNFTLTNICKIALFASVFVIVAGCNFSTQADGRADANEPTTRSAWLAYWDLDSGERDLKRMNKVDKLSFFGAYFDKYDRLFIPPELSGKKIELKKLKGKYEKYLTIVNDRQNWDGTLILKDIEVLRRNFKDEKTVDRHVDEIIALTVDGEYDGIEIDYERIWKDDTIGQSFLRFVDRLYAKVLKSNLKLRIVLEPSAPFAAAKFTKGPEYVVMHYNLFGLHSDPGPKANKEFIEKTAARMKDLPGPKSIAFSTGGCVWGDNGKRRFLTEAEAKNLAVTYGSETKRDKESQCLVFEYNDAGMVYQVWYADIETLNYWITLARQQGVNNISLWRLGGNLDLQKLI